MTKIKKEVNNLSECNKVAYKEYKTKYDWVGKVIHWTFFLN